MEIREQEPTFLTFDRGNQKNRNVILILDCHEDFYLRIQQQIHVMKKLSENTLSEIGKNAPLSHDSHAKQDEITSKDLSTPIKKSKKDSVLEKEDVGGSEKIRVENKHKKGSHKMGIFLSQS